MLTYEVFVLLEFELGPGLGSQFQLVYLTGSLTGGQEHASLQRSRPTAPSADGPAHCLGLLAPQAGLCPLLGLKVLF